MGSESGPPWVVGSSQGPVLLVELGVLPERMRWEPPSLEPAAVQLEGAQRRASFVTQVRSDKGEVPRAGVAPAAWPLWATAVQRPVQS